MLGHLLLGKYRVTRPLDEGGMSKIYLARQNDPPRDVVVKVLKDHLRTQTKALEHFKREIYITSRFEHPHAVACHDASTRPVDGGPLLILEYLRGVDLNALLQREGKLAPDRAGRLLAQLCDVLQTAHDRGIVHRDLKPGNVMILHPGTPQETVKLMDFGLAKMSGMLYISPEEIVDCRLPAASGTPEYISPEMVRGNEMDGRADLYSVGVMLFEMLTGRRPFVNLSVEDLMLAHADTEPPTFTDVGQRDVSARVEEVVRNCLAKFPDQRPKSAWELAQAYERALGKRILLSRQGTENRSTLSGTGQAISAADRNAHRHTVEANMPESMAMIKLKGFIYDLGAEVIESVPGMIKVRLAAPEEKKASSLFGWMSGGSSRQAAVLGQKQATEMELHMERRDPTQPSKLTITLLMRPAGGLVTAEWKARCNQIGRDLQAYLMGR